MVSSGGILLDWNRAAASGTITVKGKPLMDFVPQGMESREGHPGFSDVTNLQDVWEKHLLAGLDDKKRAAILVYLTENAHQGGLLYPLRRAFATDLADRGLFVNDRVGDTTRSLKVSSTPDGRVLFEEHFEVKELRSNQDPEADPVKQGMSGVCKYELSVGSDGQIACTLKKIEFNRPAIFGMGVKTTETFYNETLSDEVLIGSIGSYLDGEVIERRASLGVKPVSAKPVIGKPFDAGGDVEMTVFSSGGKPTA